MCFQLMAALMTTCVKAEAKHPAIVKEELLFKAAPFASCHASTITEGPKGTLLCAYFAGTAEGKADVAIWLSSKESGNWSEPIKIAEEKDTPCWNPVLFTTPSKEILLFYKAGKSPREWSGLFKTSSDGKLWSQSTPLPAGILGPIRSKPLMLNDGTLLCGSSIESWKRWGCFVDITKDLQNWIKSNPINVPGNLFGVIQPSLFWGQNGEIKMVMRSYQLEKVYTANSQDQGYTWSAATPTDLPNPNAPVEALNLADGRALLVFNDSKQERYPLSIALSKDAGKTWERALNLEEQEGEFSYPAAIQSKDGFVHITYTYNRQFIKYVLLDPLKL